MSVNLINEENFENEVLKSEKTVIVDFFATWCGPCQMMSPVIDNIAEELGDSIKVFKVDTDENSNLALKYDVNSIPTIAIFKDGEIKQKFIGVTEKKDIIEAVK